VVLDLPIPALDRRPALGVQRHVVGASLIAERLGGSLLIVRLLMALISPLAFR
jgi:hypothetical protein